MGYVERGGVGNFLEHGMKVRERVLERRHCKIINVSEMQI